MFRNPDGAEDSEDGLEGNQFKSLMGPETGRCRRTDGKTWRCRRDVVPDQKYCERHMHRGRSRKRVEAGVNLQSNLHTTTCSNSDTTTTTCSVKTSQKIKSRNLADTSSKFPTLIPGDCQSKKPSPSKSKGLINTVATVDTSANGKSKPSNALVKKAESSSIENTDQLNGVNSGSNHVKDTNKRNSTNGNKHGGPVTPEPNISSKSVVYGDSMEEPQRCKRTDGKRWRCRRDAIPHKKYCGSHINRGSKRCRSSSEAATVAATLVTLKNEHTNLNTDLSILHAKCLPTVIDVDSD